MYLAPKGSKSSSKKLNSLCARRISSQTILQTNGGWQECRPLYDGDEETGQGLSARRLRHKLMLHLLIDYGHGK